jgi:hypothetical protein
MAKRKYFGVPRAQRSTKWCAADPGSSFHSNRGPGSAVHHFASLVLHRVRGTR